MGSSALAYYHSAEEADQRTDVSLPRESKESRPIAHFANTQGEPEEAESLIR